RRRHTRSKRDWSSDVCSSDLDRPVIENMTLEVPPGKITSIVGPNGCGKSTLLRALSRLLKPEGGNVLLDGKPLRSRTPKQLAKRSEERRVGRGRRHGSEEKRV